MTILIAMVIYIPIYFLKISFKVNARNLIYLGIQRIQISFTNWSGKFSGIITGAQDVDNTRQPHDHKDFPVDAFCGLMLQPKDRSTSATLEVQSS